MYQLSFWQYFILNKKTTVSCLKICSVVFTGIATAIAVGVKLKTGKEEDSLMVFIASELFGYGLALLIFVIALTEGFIKAKLTIEEYNRIPFRVKESLSLELIQKPLNPKYWFMQFLIVKMIDGSFYALSEQELKKMIG